MSDTQEIVELQKQEIANLRLQLKKAISSRVIQDEVLEDIERNQSEFNRSLQVQLDKTLKTKAGLQEEALFESDEKSPDLNSPINHNQTQIEKANALIKKLKFELEMERGQVNILRHDNKLLKKLSVELHASAEQEEEFISNRLLKRIAGLKKEKGDLMVQVEQEEEYLTNSLQKKLLQLQKEKIDLENALEQEQEFVVNKLQKQLDLLRLQYPSHSPSPTIHPVQRDQTTSSPPLLPTAMVPSSPPSGLWRPGHSPSTSDYGGTSPGIVEMLKAEVNSLRLKLADLERETVSAHNQTRRYRNELNELRKTYNIPIPDDSYSSSSEAQVRAKRSSSNASSNVPSSVAPISTTTSRRHSGRSLSMSGEVHFGSQPAELPNTESTPQS